MGGGGLCDCGAVGDKELLQSVGFMLGRCLWPMLSDKGVTCLCSDCLTSFLLPEPWERQHFLLHKEHKPETVTYAVVSQGMTDTR